MIDLRPVVGKVTVPLGAALLRLGVTPDAVTITGTVGAVAGASLLLGTGRFGWGTFVVSLSLLTDALDGAMARQRPRSSPWGAFLDSTLDRIADGAVFGALAYWYATGGDSDVLCAVALVCLVAGAVTSYAKARAQSLGMTCDVGLVERTERLVLVMLGTGFTSVGVELAAPVALWLLAVGSVVTVGQRLVEVHRQAALHAP